MRKNKLLKVALIPVTLLSFASCGSNNASSTTSLTSDQAFVLTNEGYRRLNEEPGTDVVNEIIDTIVSKGSNLITGGIQTYAKAIVLNLLKECGLDFRDATTKTLEKIQEQLNVIEAKIDAMAARQEQQHSELILSPILEKIAEAQNDYVPFVVTGIAQIADYENDETLSDEELEQKRLDFYNNGVSKLEINGKPLATYVSDLADKILIPNRTDITKNIFYYYTSTLGVYDTWSSLRLKNIRNFMAYIDTTLVSLANLAKFQMYYKTLNLDEITKNTYATMINTMADKVNQVNQLFKDQLDALKPLQDKFDDGINVYLATNKAYSTRMATLTLNTKDKVGDDSRQGLLMNTYGPASLYDKYMVEYVPDQSFVAKVANDFKTYATAFCASTYTIQDYLTYAGFYAKNEELYNNAIGLYNANMYEDGHGFLNDDKEYTTTYYNSKGEYTRKAIYEVDAYHNWNFDVTRTTFTQYGEDYFLCFATPDGDKQKLDGTYKEIYFTDVSKTVQKQVAFNENIDDVNDTNKTGWFLHDCW